MISKWIRGIKRDFIPLTIRRGLYEPPKPDTPPAKVWPFGYDPIWSEDLESPTMVLVSQPFCWSQSQLNSLLSPFKSPIVLPAISPAKFPVILTPAHLKNSNMTLFDFDAAYKEMIAGLGSETTAPAAN